MKETLNFLKVLLNKEDVIVVAISGGPDSMCLLNVLNSIKDLLKLKIICAHVNHGLRIESEEEALFVEKYCEKNNIIFEYMKIDKYENNKFSEEEARAKRYSFFDELTKKYDAKFLMTAHHGDDLIETVLMRIVRGSNLKGYVGIPAISKNSNYQIVRPLLNLNKKDIYDYLKENDIKYVIDKTNEEEKYTRNRYRKHVLPFLKNEDANVHLKFLKYSHELHNAYLYINSIINEKISEIYVENYIVINKFLKEDEYIQKKIIEYVIEDIQKDSKFDINDKQLFNILEILRGNGNKEINLTNGFIARKSYNKLYIEKNQQSMNYEYIFKDKVTILDKYKIVKVKESNLTNNNIIRLNSEDLKLPLIIRTRKNGDKIAIKNLSGTKKLKDIFIDCKMDKNVRDEYPIVCDSKNNIIWIPGIKKSIFDKEKNEKYDIILKYTEE